jgi:hypothetical protein
MLENNMSRYEEPNPNYPGDPLAFPPARHGVIVSPDFVTAAQDLAEAIRHLDGLDAATLSTMPREMWTRWVDAARVVSQGKLE